MISRELKASELVKLLEAMIEKHGDQYVFSSGGDYPEGIVTVKLQKKDDGYIPKGAFYIV